MFQNPQSVVRCAPRSFSTKLAFQAGLLFLLGAVLSAGCVSKEQYESEKVRGLNFQRLLAQEEKRADTLDDKLAHKDKEIAKLSTQLKETQETIASLKSQNRELTLELNALKEQGHSQPDQESLSTSPGPDLDPSKDKPHSGPSLSDPFLSEEELRKMLDQGKTK